jgi:hypothetical protein
MDDCLQGGVFRANLAISKINSETLELTVNMEWYQASTHKIDHKWTMKSQQTLSLMS